MLPKESWAVGLVLRFGLLGNRRPKAPFSSLKNLQPYSSIENIKHEFPAL